MAGLTINSLIREVKRLAKQNPDFVYQSCGSNCFYTKSENDNDCGCIFGQAILNLQPDLKETLQFFDNSSRVPRISVLLKKLGITASMKQQSWCNSVQSSQDRKSTWACAIKRAGECDDC